MLMTFIAMIILFYVVRQCARLARMMERIELSDPELITRLKRRRKVNAVERDQTSLDVSATVKLAQIKSLRRGL